MRKEMIADRRKHFGVQVFSVIAFNTSKRGGFTKERDTEREIEDDPLNFS